MNATTQRFPIVMHALLAFLTALLAFGAKDVSAQPRPQDIDLVRALRGGGHIILMRHFQADPVGFDRDPRNFANVRQQQQLTETGRATARVVGNWLKVIGMPTTDVITSRFHRAVQSTQLLGLGSPRPTDDVTEGSLVQSPNENRRRAKALRALLSAPLPIGQNRLVMTHRICIQNALGKEWFDVKEGEASIFKVDGASYSLIARVQPEEWSRIAGAARAIDAPAPMIAPPAQQQQSVPPKQPNGAGSALPQGLPQGTKAP